MGFDEGLVLDGVGDRAVSICRNIALQVWRGARSPGGLLVSGLNSEKAVRERLWRIVELRQGAPDSVAKQLSALGWGYEAPIGLLAETEAVVGRRTPKSFLEAVSAGKPTLAPAPVHLLIVQYVGAHLGIWALRTPQLRDARLARRLYEGSTAIGQHEWRAFVRAGDRLAVDGHHVEALRAWLSADRLQRSPAVLVRALRALHDRRDYGAALWIARAALLEPPGSFGREGHFARIRAFALRLARRLETVPQGRRETSPPSWRHKTLFTEEQNRTARLSGADVLREAARRYGAQT